jgi:hypothetical protein
MKVVRWSEKIVGGESLPCSCPARWLVVAKDNGGGPAVRPGLFSAPCPHGYVALSKDFDEVECAELLGWLEEECPSTK